MNNNDNFLAINGEWLSKTADMLGRKYRIDRDDAYQLLAMYMLTNNSRHYVLLKTCREIRRCYLPTGDSVLGDNAEQMDESETAAYFDSMHDMSNELTADELFIIEAKMQGRSNAQIGYMFGITGQGISKRLLKIRRKIKGGNQ